MKNLLKISGLAFLCGLTAFGADAATYNCNKQKLDWNNWKASNEYLFVTENDNNNSAGLAYVCGHKHTNGCDNGVKIAVGEQGGNPNERVWSNRAVKHAGVFSCSTSGGNVWNFSELGTLNECSTTSGKQKYFSTYISGQMVDIYGSAGEKFPGGLRGYAINPCWAEQPQTNNGGGNNGGNNGGGNNGGGNNGGNNGGGNNGGNNGGDFYRGDGGPNNTNWNDNNNSNSNRNNNRNANQNTANGGAGGEGGMGYGEGGAGYGEGGSAYGEQNSSQRLNNRNAAQGGASNSSADFSNTFGSTFAGANFGTIKLTDRYGDYIEGADCQLLMNNGNTIYAKNGENAISTFDSNFCKSTSGVRNESIEFGIDFYLRCHNRAFVCCPKTCEKGYTPASGLDGCGCEKTSSGGNGGGGTVITGDCRNRPTEEGRQCCVKPKTYVWKNGRCNCPNPAQVFEQRNGVWECYDPKPKEDDKPVTTVTCDGTTGAMLMGNACRCTYSETRLVMEGTFGHCVCSDPNKELKGSVCEYGQSYIAKFEKTIREVRGRLDSVMGTFKESVWKDEDGNFNTARLASDSIAGVVLGTTGGLVTSKLVKKNQLKKGFEAIQCSIGGQTNASYGDEFTVGLN